MRDQVYTPELIAAATKGVDSALTILYNSTQAQVTQTVRSMIRDENAVPDLVQDSFIKGFCSLDKLDNPENFPAWMRRIAANTAVDYLRKKKPVLFSELVGEDGMEIEFEDENTDHMPDVVLDQKEISRLIQEIVSGLSDEQQLAIGMFYFEDLSVKDIAEKLDCSENTVKSRLHYGRKNIEKRVLELEKRGAKLYSLAPLPFYLWLLQSLYPEPSRQMLSVVLADYRRLTSKTAAIAHHTPGKVGMKVSINAKGSAPKKLTVKIVSGALAAAAAILAAVVLLSGGDTENSHIPEWQAPMPTVPVCVKNAHVWVDAACEVARTCSVCALTEDEPRGHDWIDANFQLPKTCRVCETTEGEPLTPGYIVHEMDGRLLDKDETYDFTLHCALDESKLTTGKLTVESYSVFDSDDTHEALEGYEWKVLVLRVRFADWNAQRYGVGYIRYMSDDYYYAGKASKTGGSSGKTFNLGWYGKKYTECMDKKTCVFENWKKDANGKYYRDIVVTFTYRLPVGYDGCVVGVSDAKMEWPLGTHLYEVIDDTARLFRLD